MTVQYVKPTGLNASKADVEKFAEDTAKKLSFNVGDSIEKFSADKHVPWLDMSSQQAYDLERFRVFSSGYLGIDKHHPNSVVDIRYSMLPHQIDAMWGIQLRPAAHQDDHALYFTRRDARSDAAQQLLDMVFHREPR